MENSIQVSAQFDFRGQTFRPMARVDLDRLVEAGDELPDYHQLLATENGIDLYSYEYEVLETSELVFAEARGLAADFLEAGRFDFTGFRQRWLEQKELELLALIARKHLGSEALTQQPGLREALQEAYQLGRGSAHRSG